MAPPPAHLLEGRQLQLGENAISNATAPKNDEVRDAAVAPRRPGLTCFFAALSCPQISRTLKQKLHEANDVHTWGAGGWGQLGHDTEDDVGNPTLVNSLLGKGITVVSCGAEHTAALSKSGELFVWGHGGNGRLGTGACAVTMLATRILIRARSSAASRLSSRSRGPRTCATHAVHEHFRAVPLFGRRLR